MRFARKVGVGAGATLGLGAVVVGGAWVWAGQQVDAVFATSWETHEVDFPVPFPLTEAEIEEIRQERLAEITAEAAEPPGEVDLIEGVDLDAIALERARDRGKHYAEAIYVCTGCHGTDLGGGKMIDDASIGKVLGPNITRGGKTKDYQPRDWDRAVRHGVLPSGLTSVMPVGDFRYLTDRELSDIIAYIDSTPPKEGSETTREWGPVGTVLIAIGQLVPDVYKVPDHRAAHAQMPPPPEPTAAYGRHIAGVCTGCHREGLEGGPIPFGPPDWPPASNLTPHEDGLKGWSYEDFDKAFSRGVKPDGSTVKVPMAEILPYSIRWTEMEKRALWAYLQRLQPTPTDE